jgi:D-glycerate 3-kinase
MIPILKRWSSGEQPTTSELQQLLAWELADERRANAFGINSLDRIEARSQLFLAVYDKVMRIGLGQSDRILMTFWQLWLPLAMELAEERSKLERPLIQGILGGQGTGKSTLAEVSRLILGHLGYETVGISIDDLYKTHTEREKLKQQDERLEWRGPPGTHDIDIGIELLDRIRDRQFPVEVPRFDKSAYNGDGDRGKSERIDRIDIVLFEGWFVGARPVEENAFENPPEPIVTAKHRKFARDSNERLKDYLPLWERLDRLIVLYPNDYRLSKQWRKEAEHKMKASGKEGMSDEQIDRFVEYFWRSLHPELFIIPLTKNPQLVNIAIEIDAEHCPSKIYRPSN